MYYIYIFIIYIMCAYIIYIYIYIMCIYISSCQDGFADWAASTSGRYIYIVCARARARVHAFVPSHEYNAQMDSVS